MKLSNSDFTVRIQYNDLSSWNGWPRYHGEYLNIQVTLTCEEKTNSFLKAECFVPEKPGREYFSSEGKQLKALYWLKDAYASSSPEQRKIIFQRYITVLSDFARPYGNLALSDNSRSIWAEELNKVWVDNPDTINETAKLMEPNATCPKYTLYWVRGEPASYDAIMECAKKANEKISYNLLQKSGISPPAMQAKALEIADGINLSYSSDAWKLAEEWYRLAGLTPEQAQKRAVGKVLKGYCKQDRESVSLAINCAYWDVVAGKSKAEARQDAIKTLERIIVKSENERDKDSRLSNDDRKEAWTYLAENDPVNGASYKARLELSYPDSK
jgi:hypothetical protein